MADQNIQSVEGSGLNGFQAQGIEKSYIDGTNRVDVLKGIDLTMKRGEMIAIVGASGVGKSTLLHILGTLDRPSSGLLFHGGENVFEKNDIELSIFRNQTIGFVFQSHHLLPEFTALENVMMPGLISGADKIEIQAEVFDILSRVGLSDRTSHKVGELSGGEQQRVALARSLIMKPHLLLADEPTGNLDHKTGRNMFALLQGMCSSFSLTTVMATHNLELAKKMDRCLTMEDGKLHE